MPPRPSPQTDRVVALVELLAAQPAHAWTLAEVTRRLGVNKSTAHSILSALLSSGWLLRDPARKTYRLGPALVPVGQAAAAGFPALDFARSAMTDLALAFDVRCAALVVGDGAVTCVEQASSPRAAGTGVRVGAAYPLRPPFGSAVLAWADARAVEAWLSYVPAGAHERYRAALAATHDRGYAVEVSSTPAARLREVLDELGDLAERDVLERLAVELVEHDDPLVVDLDPGATYRVQAVNAPVLGADGSVFLVLSLTGFDGVLPGDDVAEVGNRLVTATEAVTAALH